MTTSYAPLIRSLREAHEFSQAFVAEKLGLSRASYMAVESGKRELKLE
jgi:transcriptional regulator with XRE-family HTH domain